MTNLFPRNLESLGGTGNRETDGFWFLYFISHSLLLFWTDFPWALVLTPCFGSKQRVGWAIHKLGSVWICLVFCITQLWQKETSCSGWLMLKCFSFMSQFYRGSSQTAWTSAVWRSKERKYVLQKVLQRGKLFRYLREFLTWLLAMTAKRSLQVQGHYIQHWNTDSPYLPASYKADAEDRMLSQNKQLDKSGLFLSFLDYLVECT